MTQKSKREMNRRAAKELAKKRDFDPERMMYCVECGRAIMRGQRTPESVEMFCSCEPRGIPFVPVMKDD